MQFNGSLADFYKVLNSGDVLSTVFLANHKDAFNRIAGYLSRLRSLYTESFFKHSVFVRAYEDHYAEFLDYRPEEYSYFRASIPYQHLHLKVEIWSHNEDHATIEALGESENLVIDLVGIHRNKFITQKPAMVTAFRGSLQESLEKYQDLLSNQYVRNYLTPYFVAADEPLPYEFNRAGAVIVTTFLKPSFEPDYYDRLRNSPACTIYNLNQLQGTAYWFDDAKQALHAKLNGGSDLACLMF